jgi:MoaA/NifB/PqqE/SkfB family radical SAM enzyme
MKPDLHRFPLLVAWEMTRACLEDGALVGEGRGTYLSDGFGFVFVSSTGEVYPSGFLPLSAGNVRERPLLEIYRESLLFQELRNKQGASQGEMRPVRVPGDLRGKPGPGLGRDRG